jgi:predicted small lipoprotein YifL
MMKKLFAFVILLLMLSVLAGCGAGSPIQSNTPVPTAAGSKPASNNQINVPGATIQVYTPGSNPLMNKPDALGHVAGIGLGLWHGFISPVTMVVSFFNKNVQIYEVHNNGSQYNLGFVLGLAVLLVVLVLLIRR